VTRSLDMKLRVLRAERQLSLREASELTGVDKVSLSRFERGLAHPQDRTLGKIANGYGVPVTWLLEEPVLSGKADAPADTGQPRPDPAFYDQEERLLRYLRVPQLFAAKQTELWAAMVERGDFGEEVFRKGVDAFADLESAFVQGVGTDLTAALREDEDTLPKAEREALDAAKASIDAWCRLLHEAFDILKAATDAQDAEAQDASNVRDLAAYRKRLEERPSAVGE
jgi:transcriptional regulator with XRE-family HTH domain